MGQDFSKWLTEGPNTIERTVQPRLINNLLIFVWTGLTPVFPGSALGLPVCSWV